MRASKHTYTYIQICHSIMEMVLSKKQLWFGGRVKISLAWTLKLLGKQFIAWRKSEEFLGLDIETACMIFSDDSLNIESEMDVFMTAGNSLSDDSLNVDSEMDVFMTAVDLISHLLADEKEKSIEKIIGCIRFPLLTGEVT